MSEKIIVRQNSAKVTVRQIAGGVPGVKGDDGLSAYQIWLNQGNTGTIQDYLNSLKGAKGDNGISAYQVWLNQGNTGTEQDYINSLKGDDGLSSYQVWLAQGNTGTVQDYLNSLKGVKGDDGLGVPSGGTTGQVLTKVSNTDNDTTWSTPSSGAQSQIIASKKFSGFTDELGGLALLQNALFRKRVSYVIPSTNPVFNGGNLTGFNFNSFNQNGGNGSYQSPRNVVGKEFYYNQAVIRYQAVDSPTTNAVNSGMSVMPAQYYVGKTNGAGGFFGMFSWGIGTDNDNASKLLIGYHSHFTGVPNLTPGISNMLNTIGLGFDETDSVFHIFVNNGSGVAEKFSLATFEGNLLPSDIAARVKENFYEFCIKVDKGSNVFFVEFTNLHNGHKGYKTITTTKMPFDAYFCPVMMIGASAGKTRIDAIDVKAYYGEMYF